MKKQEWDYAKDQPVTPCVADEPQEVYARQDKGWYVCGPMTGLPRFNYPLFDIVTLDLRRTKNQVVSPTELDSRDMQGRARASLTGNFADFADLGESWGDILARDVKLIEHEIGHFALLP